MPDGKIVFSTELDNKDLEKQLVQAKKKISSIEDSISKKQSERMPLVKQAEELEISLERARQKLVSMQTTPSMAGKDAIKEQQTAVRELQSDYNAVQRKVMNYDDSIQKATSELERQKNKAGDLTAQIAEANVNANMMSPALARAEKHMDKFITRVKGLARRVFIFTVITAALRSMKNWMGEVIKTNSEATAATARLKGALLTLAQPLVNVIIPVFTEFVNILADVVSAIANVVSTIFGTTAEKSAEAAKKLYEEQKAIKGVGSAAKKSGKSLASFDQINKLSGESDSGSSSKSGTTPDFGGMIKSKLDEITAYVSGALLAIGAILAFSGANIPLGIGLMALGAIGLASVAMSNWGAMPENVREALTQVLLILGTAMLVIGAILVFSGVAIPAGLALMAAGALSLAAAAAVNWDSMSEQLREKLSVIMEVVFGFVLAIGIMLALSGVNIPLGIAMIAMGAIGIAGATALDWKRLSTDLSGTLGKILAIVGSFMAVIGTILILTGVNIPLGLGLLVAGIACFGVASCALQWDQIQSGVQEALGTILKVAGGCLFVLGLILALTGVAIPLGLGLMVAGAASLGVAALTLNWDAILEKMKEAWNNIKNWWKTSVSKYFTADWWKQLGKDMLNGLIDSIESGLNYALTGVGSFVNGVSGILNKIPGVNIENVDWGNVKLPRLATGAVIPPNREFLAVLGDQKSGMNIEAPISTIESALENVLSRMGIAGGRGETTVILELDKTQFGKVTFNAYNDESRRVGVNIAEVY